MPARLIKRPVRRIIKRVRYPPDVEARLDPQRPKYSEAVKSLAAFATDERKFYVLVSHLDAACAEANKDGWHELRRELKGAAWRIKR